MKKLLNEIVLFIEELKATFAEYIFLKKMQFRLKMEIKMADMKHYITDKRYLVIPDLHSVSGMTNACSDQFPKMKKQGRIKASDGFLETERKAFYMTPLRRSGEGAPTIEQKIEMSKNFARASKLVRRMPKVMKGGKR